MSPTLQSRIWPHLVLFLFLALGVMGETLAKNVLLFTIDSCRFDRFGVYGHSANTTPRIDKWAKSGVVFEKAYSTSAWTAPGLVSALTGLYPPTHGVNNRDRSGWSDMPTLATLLAKEGYRIPNLNFFTFAPYYQNLGFGGIDREYFGPKPGEAVLNWISRQGQGGSPFLLWYHTTMVHQPYAPPKEFLDAPFNTNSPGIQAVMKGAIVPVGSTTFTPQDLAPLNQLYDGQLRQVDQLFGQVIDLLKDKGLLDETLIVLTADHGEELLDHGFVGHASTSLQAKLYEETIHIPLILSWPGKIPQGKRDNRLASQIDILPTILELLGLGSPPHVQGKNLLGNIEERSLFFESVIAGNQTPKDREEEWVRAIRKGSKKFISTGELYDLRTDPRESQNLASTRPEEMAQLERELQYWLDTATRSGEQLGSYPSSVRETVSKGPRCPQIMMPGEHSILQYDTLTGLIILEWTGSLETDYVIEYNIGTDDHHVQGAYDVQGNHQLLGPFPKEVWDSLKAFNPFQIRVAVKSSEPCWSDWRTFNF